MKKIKTTSKIKMDGVTEMNIEIKGNVKFYEKMTREEVAKELNKIDNTILIFDAKCDWKFIEDFMNFLKTKSSEKGKY